MRTLATIAGLALLWVTCTTGNVINVNNRADFKKEVTSSKSIVFVEFFAPWCGHCKALEPEWAAAARILDGVVKFVAVDATVAKDLANEYGVQGYPTCKVFGRNKKSPTDYQGPRTSKDLVSAAVGEVQKLVRVRQTKKSKKGEKKSNKNSEKKNGSKEKKSNENSEKNNGSKGKKSNENSEKNNGTKEKKSNEKSEKKNGSKEKKSNENSEKKNGSKEKKEEYPNDHLPHKPNSRVVDFTSSKEALKIISESDAMWLIEVYGDRDICPKCEKFALQWKEAAKTLEGSGILLGAIDMLEAGDVFQKYNVKISVPLFPYILQFPPGIKTEAVQYTGPHDGPGIVKYALEELEKLTYGPKEIHQLTSKDMLKEHCNGNTICTIAVMPDIGETGKNGREEYLTKYKDTVTKFKSKRKFAYLWSEAGSQMDLETKFGLMFGFPALAAFNVEKSALAVHIGPFDVVSITKFIHGVSTGRISTKKLSIFPNIESVAEWDGGEAPVIEEEFSLEELMGDDEL